MKKIVTMGEIMLRLSTPNNEKFIQADEFDINYGGGEANVAVSCANYGHKAEFVTAVPDNELGECAIAALRKYGVQTDHIAKCGERLGIYYLETGASMRPSKVVYDRAHSSITTATKKDFDFDAIFEGADWFHFTGITPAVSDSAAVLTEEALKAAKKHGVTVSVDLNFRKKLWSSEKAFPNTPDGGINPKPRGGVCRSAPASPWGSCTECRRPLLRSAQAYRGRGSAGFPLSNPNLRYI